MKRWLLSLLALMLILPCWSQDDLGLGDDDDDDGLLGDLNELTKTKKDFAGLENSCFSAIGSWHLVKPQRRRKGAPPKTYPPPLWGILQRSIVTHRKTNQ